jgi:uncharacterized OB-fold protein
MKKAQRWICSACGGNFFPDHALARGKCPSCGGQGDVRSVDVDDSGVVHVRAE